MVRLSRTRRRSKTNTKQSSLHKIKAITNLTFWKFGLLDVTAVCVCSQMLVAIVDLIMIAVTDVGGGSVANDVPHNLARIPLRWMIRQCFLTKTGIRFHTDLLPTIGLDPAALWPQVLPRPPALANAAISSISNVPSTSAPADTRHQRLSTSATLINYADVPPAGAAAGSLTEEQEDLLDARCDIYDQLALSWGWWVLEILPLRHKVQEEDFGWESQI